MLKANNNIIAEHVEYADSPISKMLGLMFRGNIDPNYSLIFTLSKPRKVSVHMHFVKFPIDVILLNETKNIIQMDTLEASKGKLKAFFDTKYIIEMQAGTIKKEKLKLNDQLQF